MYWVGHEHDGVTILEREYDTLKEAQNDPVFKGYGKYGRSGWIIVETDDPDQWEKENNRDGISFR